MRRSLLILALTLMAPLSAQPPGSMPGARPAIAAGPTVTVTDIALVYTGETPVSPMQIEPWDPSGPTLGELIGARVDYLLVEPAPIVLENGARMPLTDLQITVFGLDGGWVAGAPLKVSLEAPEGMLSRELAVESQSLFAMRPGYARLWVESLLPRGTGTGEHYRLPVVILVR